MRKTMAPDGADTKGHNYVTALARGLELLHILQAETGGAVQLVGISPARSVRKLRKQQRNEAASSSAAGEAGALPPPTLVVDPNAPETLGPLTSTAHEPRPRTFVPARKSAGGKAPVRYVATKAARKVAPYDLPHRKSAPPRSQRRWGPAAQKKKGAHSPCT